MKLLPLALFVALTSGRVLPGPTLGPTRRARWQHRSSELDMSFLARADDSPLNLTRRQEWQLTQPGTSGVAAMQMAVVSSTQVIFIDRVEHNPLMLGTANAWSALYDLNTNTVRPVSLQTDSFCAGGAFLSNGTLVDVGGNPIFSGEPDTNGLQGMRLFDPASCPDNATSCSWYENPTRVRLATPRWYPGVVKLQDGSIMIVGGSKYGVGLANTNSEASTIEFFPAKNIHGSNGLPIPLSFLVSTLNANLFPHVILVPGGQVVIIANNGALLYNWQTNVSTPLPNLPNGVRVGYPMSGTAALLPLARDNTGTYVPTILVCGGSAQSDQTAESTWSSQTPASAQCSTLQISAAGIAAGWTVEMMPEGRVMPNAVLLPDGRVIIVNGAQTGFAGYDNVQDLIGYSNADHPAFQPVIYDPSQPVGSRFSSAGLPTSSIARLYHSTASMTPSGAVIVAGSNPNGDVELNEPYPTEYRVEFFEPPYFQMIRPTILFGVPEIFEYSESIIILVTLPPGTQHASAVLMDFGFSTHAVQMGQRLVQLKSALFWWEALSTTGVMVITAPPHATIFPPGRGWLFVLADGVPSVGASLIVGKGQDPPVDTAAIENMLAMTKPPSPTD